MPIARKPSGPSAKQRGRGVWVPAVAGTTDSNFERHCSFRQNFTISPHVLREVCSNVPPSEIRGRRECRAPDAPAAARVVVVNTRVSHHGHTGTTRHSPRNGFQAYFVLL